MKDGQEGDHPLRRYFADELHESLAVRSGLTNERVEEYLCRMLFNFVHYDGIYKIRDLDGRRIRSVVDMLPEGDVSLNADSFEREREVHKHIGDYLLFVTGMFPEFLRPWRQMGGKDEIVNPIVQGRRSYYVASTFDYGDYAGEAPVFRRLSEQFEEYISGLSMLRQKFKGMGPG